MGWEWSVALALNGGALCANTLAQPLRFQNYWFRNRLAQQIVNAISGTQSRKKNAFSFVTSRMVHTQRIHDHCKP